MRPVVLGTVALLPVFLVLGVPAAAQERALAAPCPGLPTQEGRETCFAVAQAIESAQPQVGLAITGGNPVPGAASPLGLRFGRTPRLDFSGQVNVVAVRLPDILAGGAGTTARRLNQTLGLPAPALGATVSVGVLPGGAVAPGVGGIGSMDVLAGASWLPFRAFGVRGFGEESPELAWGAGLRMGVLRESFRVPGISVSLMYHSLGRAGFGDVCRGEEVPTEPGQFHCVAPGDAGEFGFDLRNWSTRGVIGKRFVGLGFLAGAGYDRYSSEIRYAFRFPDPAVPDAVVVVRPEPLDLSSSRWLGFANLSYTLLLATLSFEAGWQSGGEPIAGFAPEARFDPHRGTWFGSVAARLSF